MAGDLALPGDYAALLGELKDRIRSAQTRAALAVNRELVLLYWHIGRAILGRQAQAGWGAGVIDQLSRDLKREFPEIKGFSRSNLSYMQQFAATWPDEATVQQLVGHLPWGHNIALMQKLKDPFAREWYARATIEHGWSRNILIHQMGSRLRERQGQATTNFGRALPAPQSELAQQLLKDPYNFDFLSLGQDALERDLERGLLAHLRDFMLELGVGFAFVGSQYHLEVGGEDFYLDLLFYHLRLRCYVVIELKIGEFRPEYVGKLNFYLSAADESILALERPLNREGYVLEVLPVDSAGRVAPEVLKSRLRDDVLLVSIQAANNEVGTLQRVAELADAAHAAGALFHTDATQWIGKLPVDVASWDVDLLSLSAHKFYGPKGVGALFVQGGVSAQPLEPLIYGGGQEWALRSGTHNVPGIVGMGHAAELTATELFEESKRLGSLRDELEKGLRRDLPEVRVNGWLEERLPHCSSLTFPGVDSEALIVQLKDFALSNGAACQSGTIEPSHVLLALGMSRSEAYNTLRVSVGRDTTLADVSALRAAVFACVSDFNKT